MKNKLLQRKAFTLLEVLIVVAVITVLMAVGVPMVSKLTKDTKIKELDDYAKTVYLEAQNHLLEMKANGELDALVARMDTENALAGIDGIKYFDNAETSKDGLYYLSSQEEMLAEIIPVGAGLDGDFLIEFNPETGEVHGVFYVEDGELNYFTDVMALASRSTEERKSKSIGYYGGKISPTPVPTMQIPDENGNGGGENGGDNNGGNNNGDDNNGGGENGGGNNGDDNNGGGNNGGGNNGGDNNGSGENGGGNNGGGNNGDDNNGGGNNGDGNNGDDNNGGGNNGGGTDTTPTTPPTATPSPTPTATPTPTPIVAPTVKSVDVVNAEELYLKIAFDWTSTKNLNDFILEVQVTGLESGETVTLTPDKTNTEMVGLDREIYVLLDSMVNGSSFADIVGTTLKQGEDIKITVVTKNAEHPTVRQSKDAGSYNSLFASKNGNEIKVTSLRHLKNLEKYNPNNQATKIVLGADIDFKTKAFVWVEDAFGNCVYMRHADTPRPATLESFAPLENAKIFARNSSGSSFDGQNHKLINFVITGNGNGVGLFKELKNMTVSNVKVQDITVKGDNYENVGALAGTISNSTITNCGVYLSTESVDGVKHIDVTYIAGRHDNKMERNYNDYSIKGKKNVGGFCGSAEGTTFDNCYAAVQVFGTECVGGFAGKLAGEKKQNGYGWDRYYTYSAEVKNSYSSGAVNAAEGTATSMGGFVGTTEGTSYNNCYTTSEVNAGAGGISGGFAATDKNCEFVSCTSYAKYTVATTKKVRNGDEWVEIESEEQVSFDAFSNSSSGSNFENCKYLTDEAEYSEEYSEKYCRGYEDGYNAGYKDRYRNKNSKPNYKGNRYKGDYREGYDAGYEDARAFNSNKFKQNGDLVAASYSSLLGEGGISYPYSGDLNGHTFPFTCVTSPSMHYGDWPLSGDHRIDDDYIEEDDGDDDPDNDGIKEGDELVDVPTVTVTPTHVHSWIAMSQEATCTEKGKTWKVCFTCEEICNESDTPALGHDYGSWVVDTDASCTAEGTKHKTCQRAGCGHTETGTIDILPHTWQVQSTLATCTEQGVTREVCVHCTAVHKEAYVPALGHSWGSWKTVTEPTCSSEGVKEHECSRCGHTETGTIPVLEHKWQAKSTAATCTEDGKTWQACSDCTATQNVVVIPALGHNYGNWIVDTTAGCETAGAKHRTCQRTDCGHTENETIAAFGHNWLAKSNPATCTEDGKTWEECSNCAAIQNEAVVEALGHNVGEWIVKTPAGCEITGERQKTCQRAGCEYKESETIAALEHKWQTESTPATCTGQGVTQEVCAYCAKTQNAVYSNALGHNLGNWIEDTVAGCETTGERHKECSRCSHEVWETIPKTEHSYKDSVTSPTCEDKGYTTHTCEKCGKSYKDTETAALDHEWGPWVITKTEKRTEGFWFWAEVIYTDTLVRTCVRCGDTDTDTHEYSEDEHKHKFNTIISTVEATCTTAAYTDKQCSCGDIFREFSGDALGHSYDWKVTTEATCVNTGIKVESCTRCGHLGEKEVIPVTSHKPVGEWTFTKLATCEEDGHKHQKCEICGKPCNDTVVNALGHSWTGWTVKTAATCKTTGLEIKYCTTCGETETRDIAVSAHVLEEVYDKNATCTEAGQKHQECKYCGEKLNYEEVAALGHSWTAWTVETAATCEHAGVEARVCNNCGHKETSEIAAKAHNWEWIYDEDATCTTNGRKHEECSNCHATQNNNTVVPALNHSWTTWEETTPATCETAGVESRHCTRCNHAETRTIAAKGHDWEWVSDRDATCTTTGLEHEECKNCHKTRSDNTVVGALGHAMTEWTVKTAATCEKAGVESKSCTRCGYEETRTIAAKGHDLEWIVEQNATCTANGHKHQKCNTCGKTFDEAVMEALGHDWNGGVYTEPTTESDGFTTYSCQRAGCDASYVDWNTGSKLPEVEIPPTVTPDDMQGGSGFAAGIGLFYYEIYADGNGDGRDELGVLAVDLFAFEVVNTIVFDRRPIQYGFGVYYNDEISSWWFGNNKEEVGDQDGNLDVVEGYTFIVMSTGTDSFSVKIGDNSLFSQYEMVAPVSR